MLLPVHFPQFWSSELDQGHSLTIYSAKLLWKQYPTFSLQVLTATVSANPSVVLSSLWDVSWKSKYNIELESCARSGLLFDWYFWYPMQRKSMQRYHQVGGGCATTIVTLVRDHLMLLCITPGLKFCAFSYGCGSVNSNGASSPWPQFLHPIICWWVYIQSASKI